MHFTKVKSLFLRFSLKSSFYNFRISSFKKSFKNPFKMKLEHLKNRCQKHILFWYRLFRILASILEGLGPPSWSQIGRLGLPGRSQKPPKSNLLGACVQDACQEAPKWLPGSPRRRFLKDFPWIWEPFFVTFGCKNWFSWPKLQVSHVLVEWRHHLKNTFLQTSSHMSS